MKPAIPSIDRQTRMAAVVFADLVGFSKKPVPAQLAAKEALTGLLQRLVTPYPANSRVVLDTGDGAAVGFLVSPEYALGLALRLRRELDAAPGDGLLRSQDLRLGINLGPLKVVTDVNGHPNLLGEGINSAERIMSFADPGGTTASRSFQEAVYYLDASFQTLFEPLGMRTDKHGREHEVFRLTSSAPAIDAALQSLGAAGRPSSTAASSKRGLRPVWVGLVLGVIVVGAGAASWLAWPPRVAREAPATTSAPPIPPPTAPPAPAASTPAEPAPVPAQASPAPADRRPPADATSGTRTRPLAASPKSPMAGSPAPAARQEGPRAGDPAASQRCSRLLQRAAVGEVLTPDEQRELTTTCR